MSQFSLRLPDSLMDEAKLIAEQENVSLNHFFQPLSQKKCASLKPSVFLKSELLKLILMKPLLY